MPTMNDCGCFVLTYDTGFYHHRYSYFDTLKEHLEYHCSLEDLFDLHSITFNDRHAIMPDYYYNYTDKDMQIQRIINHFELLATNTGSIYCSDCYQRLIEF